MQIVSPLGIRRDSHADAAIVVDDVAKRFQLHRDRPTSLKERLLRRGGDEPDEFWAVRDVSLSIEAGTTYGIVGHNGSGKSSLLRLIAGIYEPTRGNITVHGRVAALLELGAGFHPELTGRENIYLNASILGLARREIEGRIDHIIDFSGIGDFVDSPVKIYSSGMYVRLGFAVAVNVDPDILLIDEVVAVGDAEFQRQCFDHLHEMRMRGVTIVVVTHDHNLVRDLCGKAAWLDHGRLLAEGDAADVVDAYITHVNDNPTTISTPAGAEVDPDARPGTGSVRITDYDVLGDDGTPTRSVLSGSALGIRVRYRTNELVHDPVLAISVVRADGAEVTWLRTDLGRVELGDLDGEGTIVYRIPAVPLLEGTYVLSFGFYSRDLQTAYDSIDGAEHIAVFNTTDTRAAGLVDLGGGEWTHERTAPAPAPAPRQQ